MSVVALVIDYNNATCDHILRTIGGQSLWNRESRALHAVSCSFRGQESYNRESVRSGDMILVSSHKVDMMFRVN